MDDKIVGISDEAVVSATGEGWSHWLELLDEHDGTAIDHKERVAVLGKAGIESGWWHQQLAVGYEQERGLREVGETADAGYAIGVQRTLSIHQTDLWAMLTSPDGVETWLGATDGVALEPGETYATHDGTIGEIRTRSDGERLRLTWQPDGRGSPTTLQLTLTPAESSDEKTVLRFHQEKLADSTEREVMRDHWKSVASMIEGRIDGR